VVKVQSLNQIYLGHESDKGLRLVHVRQQAVEKHKLEAQPAAEVLAGLVPLAREHDGQAR
jgi:hypothetical protein